MNNIGSIYGNTLGMMGKSLDYLWLKQGVTSSNMSNVETPGYKAKYLRFEDEFRNRMDAASGTGRKEQMGMAIQSAAPSMHVSEEESARLDGNNVNADVEMIELTRTALQYQYGLNAINGDILRLRSAIKGQ